MPLQVTGASGPNNGDNGLAESMEVFVNDHLATDRQMRNHLAGRKLTAPLPAYDPTHSDNKWPIAIHHSVRDPEIIGVSLVGLVDVPLGEKARSKQEAANEAALKHALSRPGWQLQPYVKPNVRVLSPEEERADLLNRLREKDEKLASLADRFAMFEAEQRQAQKQPESKGGK